MQETFLSQNWNLQPNAILSGKVAENFCAKEYKKSVLPKISSAQYACQPGLGSTEHRRHNLYSRVEDWIFPKAFDSLPPGKLLKPFSLWTRLQWSVCDTSQLYLA